VEFSLSPLERQRLAALLAAAATLLLLVFVLAVALPLLPPRLLDPLWQLAFTAALTGNGFLALLAVLLINLAAALEPEAEWLLGRRQLVGSLCRWVALAFLLLIPLQGLAAWRALDWAGVAASRGASQGLQRIAQFRQAVVSANSVAALQANLAAIQAPPLGPRDQSQGLAVIKAGLLGQLQVVEQQALPGKSLDPARLIALGKDTLKAVLLSLGLALGFAAAAQRKGSELSLRAEWRQAAEGLLEAGLSRRAEKLARREEEWLQRQEFEELQELEESLNHPEPQDDLVAARGKDRPRRGAVDASYFETLAGGDDAPPG
jgi:hypothetical protein